jgi:seryl-tRNA synthetase
MKKSGRLIAKCLQKGRCMIDIRLLRRDQALVQKKLQTKVADVETGPILRCDEQVREKKTEVERLKAQRNEASDSIGKMKREKKDCSKLLEEMTAISDRIHQLDHEVAALEEQLVDGLSRLPNIPLDDVPVSPSPKDNVMVHSFGQKPTFAFTPKNHVELNDSLGCFDFQRGAKLSGSGWPMYKGLGARLEWALLNYMIDSHVRRGYIQWMPPIAVRKEVLFASGQLPKFANQQYKVSDDEQELYLIPTAEVALNGIFLDEIVPLDLLPLKYIAYTPCFRREAGAAGSNERGLIRTHQFNKVEMFAFTTPEQSPQVFEEFVKSAESILEGLQLHHRSMLLTTGDMSFAAAKTIDVEVWLPGQDRYYEVSSVSNCTDFQSRRSNTKFRKGTEKPELVHTLNGSGLATSRLMVAILENNQQPDGSVVIPQVLRPYLGGLERLEPRSPFFV